MPTGTEASDILLTIYTTIDAPSSVVAETTGGLNAVNSSSPQPLLTSTFNQLFLTLDHAIQEPY